MPAGSVLETALLGEVRAHFAASPQLREWTVVLALPCGRRGADTLASLLGGRTPEKRRVLALAVREAEPSAPGEPSFKAALHVLKAEAAPQQQTSRSARVKAAQQLSLSETLKLRALARLEGGAAEGDGRCLQAVLVFEAPLGRRTESFTLEDPSARTLLMGAVWHLAREGCAAGAAPPGLAGLAASDARAWADAAARELHLPSRASAVDSDSESQEAEARGPEVPQAPQPRLVSDEEAAALQSLLDSYRLDVGDATVLEDRLRREASALEASNVHALLEADADLAAVMRLLQGAQSELDDLAQWLGIFNVKLVHMRADISAIESRNNRLDRQARNNAAVLAPLQTLLAALTPPPGMERALGGALAPGGEARGAVRAARELRAALDACVPTALPPGADAMAAVKAQRANLSRLRGEFVARAAAQVRRGVTDAVDGAAAAGKRGRDPTSGLPRAHDPAASRAALKDLQPLLRAVTALEPEAAPQLREAHAQALGAALRRTARDLAAGARLVCKEEGARATPSRAFAAVVEELVTLALDEADFLAELHEDAAGEGAAMGAVFGGVAPELAAAAEWASKADPPATVALIGAVGRAALAAAERRCCREAATASLSEVQGKLRGLLSRFVDEKVGALGRNDGQGSSGGASSSFSIFSGGTSKHEVLPEVAKMLPLIARLETLAAADARPSASQRRGSASSSAAAASDGRREAVDLALGRLVPALLSCVERAAVGDQEHCGEVRLRNYAAFLDALAGLGGGGLDGHLETVQAVCEQARQGYADDLWLRTFPAPLELLGRIEGALATGMGPESVTFQAGLARSDARRVLKEALGTRRVEKGLQEAHARCAKHFKGPLFQDTWHAAQGSLLQRYERLEELVLQVYGDALLPGASELEELFQAV
jgi:hypothetical protein